MKIVIVGPGAMGCLFAALLSKGKSGAAAVWLLDKSKERASRLRQKGITVTAAASNWHTPVLATADPQEIGEADLVVVCVKSYDTKAAVERCKGLVGENTLVMTLQNGIGNIEIISEVVGAEKVIGGVTHAGAILEDAGSVRYTGKGETIIGRLDGRIPVQMRSLREIFSRAGIQLRLSRDIKGLLWSKLLINVGINALSAVTRLSNGKLIELDGTRRILHDVVTEGIKVAKRKRIKLLYDDPIAKVEAVCEATSENVSSMLQDVLRKKKTEIDFLNGVIVRQGQELGIAVPVNSALVDLVKTIETSYELQLMK